MNKFYLVGPLAALAVFGAAYWRFETHYAARQEEFARQTRAAIAAKLAQDAAERSRARTEALAARDARQRERAEAERRVEEQKLAREDAERRRAQAADRARKLQAQLDRLRLETENMKHFLATAEENRRVLQGERQFLQQCVEEAEANRKGFFELLQKLEQYDAARAREASIRRPSA